MIVVVFDPSVVVTVGPGWLLMPMGGIVNAVVGCDVGSFVGLFVGLLVGAGVGGGDFNIKNCTGASVRPEIVGETVAWFWNFVGAFVGILVVGFGVIKNVTGGLDGFGVGDFVGAAVGLVVGVGSGGIKRVTGGSVGLGVGSDVGAIFVGEIVGLYPGRGGNMKVVGGSLVVGTNVGDRVGATGSGVINVGKSVGSGVIVGSSVLYGTQTAVSTPLSSILVMHVVPEQQATLTAPQPSPSGIQRGVFGPRVGRVVGDADGAKVVGSGVGG